MHDPMTVAFDIKSPFRQKPDRFWPEGHRNTIATIWHVDPERDGTDDSCGWFKRSRHGDKETLAKIQRAFASEWDGEYTGWFAPNGMPVQSVLATTLAMFRRAAFIHYGDSWSRTDVFMRRHLLEIITFAENRVDSLSDSLLQRFGRTERADRIENFAHVIYGCILRWEQPWYRHPRWHVWHWKIQIHAVQAFKRWAFSRCATCGRRFLWGYSPVSMSWDSDGPLWFRGERGVHHQSCVNQGGPCEAAKAGSVAAE